MFSRASLHLPPHVTNTAPDSCAPLAVPVTLSSCRHLMRTVRSSAELHTQCHAVGAGAERWHPTPQPVFQPKLSCHLCTLGGEVDWAAGNVPWLLSSGL